MLRSPHICPVSLNMSFVSSNMSIYGIGPSVLSCVIGLVTHTQTNLCVFPQRPPRETA